MVSIPLLPPLPTFLNPSTFVNPIKTFLAQPTSIDYSSIPPVPPTSTGDESGRLSNTIAHSGLLARLPLSTCPICHLRRTTTPVPIADTSSGSAISLPPMTIPGEDDQGHEDERIFVPAETDCWGRCRWCYYCIAGELAKHREDISQRLGQGAKKVEKMERIGRTDENMERQMKDEEKWQCLRCGGGVTRAWRVGAEPVETTFAPTSDSFESEGASSWYQG